MEALTWFTGRQLDGHVVQSEPPAIPSGASIESFASEDATTVHPNQLQIGKRLVRLFYASLDNALVLHLKRYWHPLFQCLVFLTLINNSRVIVASPRVWYF